MLHVKIGFAHSESVTRGECKHHFFFVQKKTPQGTLYIFRQHSSSAVTVSLSAP